LRPDDLIYKSGKAWAPVEITKTRAGFLDAWEIGAKEWRESSAKGQAEFISVREAWKIYEPVGLPGSPPSGKLPDDAQVLARFSAETARFVNREISSRVRKLQEEIAATRNSPKSINKLGVLYARYGQMESAEREFQRTLAIEEYTPALVNLGNLALRKKEVSKAISYFGRAVRRDPASPVVLLGLARAYYAKGDAQQLDQFFSRLQSAAPDLAEKHAYLGRASSGTARAVQAEALEGRMVWVEE
jgi:tetratricopeptide (TPR) repeat protein